ncbi:MAG: hypothetical protein ACFFEN_02320 [Candidatus Thorarchaeota archaeon]
MNYIEKYIEFSRRFHDCKLPKLKFKELNERNHNLYRKLYNIHENDINKASFVIFIVSFFICLSASLLFTPINFLIVILYSLGISLIFSRKFNLILYKDLIRKEAVLNSILYLIKIDFSLIQKTALEHSDNCLNFIELVKEYRIPISPYFKVIFKRIHEGKLPENELSELITPSSDFDNYIRSLLISNFDNKLSEISNENSLETQFKIYLKQLQSKISILFFIGLFYPIGTCFLILFQILNLICLIFLIPVFLVSLNLLFRKFMRNQGYLIGLISDYSSIERRKFEEFILFLRSLASNLKSNISPEDALLKSYKQNRNLILLLKNTLKTHVSNLLTFSSSFNEILNSLKSELKSLRYVIVLDALKRFIVQNSYLTSDKIQEILTVIYKHQNLGKKLEIILKGEKFKIFFFIFLLPIITGAISGFFPFFNLVIKNVELIDLNLNFFFENELNLFNLVMILLVLLFSISITSYFFLKTLFYNKKLLIILCSCIIFLLSFLIVFLNVPNYI